MSWMSYDDVAVETSRAGMPTTEKDVRNEPSYAVG